MAFIFKRENSNYWQAGWKDELGKRKNRSTKLPNQPKYRRQAQKIADEFELSSKKKRAARQVREVISVLHQDITGQEFPTSTFRQFSQKFVDMKKAEWKVSTEKYYQTSINSFVAWLGTRADSDLNDLSIDDLSAYRNELQSKVSTTTTGHKMKALRAIFQLAGKQGYMLEDPTEGMTFKKTKRGSEGKVEKRPFTMDEIAKILSTSSPEWKSMTLFGLYTGQRLGDLALLKWDSINTKKNEVKFHTNKTDRSITIPLSDSLKAHVSTIIGNRKSSPYVHPDIAEKYSKSSSTVSHQFSDILAKCGLRDKTNHASEGKGRDSSRESTQLSFHCLRVTAATLLHEAGISEATVLEWIGHDCIEVHKLYVKIGRDQLQKASNSLPSV